MTSAGTSGNLKFNREAIRAKFAELLDQNPKKSPEWCIRETAEFMAEKTPAGTLMHLRRHHALKPYRLPTIRDWIHGHIGGRGRAANPFAPDLVCPGGVHNAPAPALPTPQAPPPGPLEVGVLEVLHTLEAKLDKVARDSADRDRALAYTLDEARKELRDQVGDLVAVEVAGGNGRMRREASKRFPASVPLGH